MKLCWLRLQTKRDAVKEHLQGTPGALEGRARTWDWLHSLWARGPCCNAPQGLYPPIRELCPRAPSLFLTPLPLQGNWELLNAQTSHLPSHVGQGYKWDTWNRGIPRLTRNIAHIHSSQNRAVIVAQRQVWEKPQKKPTLSYMVHKKTPFKTPASLCSWKGSVNFSQWLPALNPPSSLLHCFSLTK